MKSFIFSLPIPKLPRISRSRWGDLDRSFWLSLLVSGAFAIAIIQAHELLAPGSFVRLASFIATRYSAVSAPVYSLVHHRPMEVCDTYVTDKSASLVALSNQYLLQSGVWQTVRAVQALDDQSRNLFEAPCRGTWVWQPGSGNGHIYAQFGRDAWAAWLYERFSVTEARSAVFVVVGVGAGAFGLSQLAFALSGSNLLAIFALLGVAMVDKEISKNFEQAVLFAWYGFSTAWLIAVFARKLSHRLGVLAALVTALSVNFLGYLIIAHSAAFLFVGVSLLLFAAAVLAKPSRAKMAGLVAVAVIVLWGLEDCSRFVKRQLAGVSVLNFASSGSFGSFALTTGFWTERPNPWSYPLGDYGVQTASFAEPLIRDSAPLTFDYQGASVVGRQLLFEMLRHPLVYLDNIWRRAALHVWKLPIIAEPTYNVAPKAVQSAALLIVLAVVLGVGTLCRPHRWPLELPLVGVILSNFFALGILTHLVHTHASYFLPGLLQVLLAAPLLVIISATQLRALIRHVRLADAFKLRLPLVVVLIASAVLGSHVVRGFQQELATFDVWYQPWIGVYTKQPSKESLDPDAVAQKIEYLRQFGESTPGSISMYAAWTYFRLAANVWLAPVIVGERLGMEASEVETFRKRSTELAVASFRRAQVEAPNDPWIPTFATVIDPESSVHLYTRALDQNPNGIFAPHFAYYLYQTVPGGQRYRDQFEQLTHDRLRTSASIRPGYQPLPLVETDAKGRADDEKAERLLTLDPGETVVIGPAKGYGTNRAKVFVYVRVDKGSVDAGVEIRVGTSVTTGDRQTLTPADPYRYRVFNWVGDQRADAIVVRLTAGEAGAELLLRDFYPLIENPHHNER